MELNKKGIFISMFQMAEQGELNKLEQKEIINALYSFGVSRIGNRFSTDIDDIQDFKIEEDFKRIRLGCRDLLEQTEQCIDTALDMLKDYQNLLNNAKIDLKNLPEFAIMGDDEETLEFINKINKDILNFTEAEKLVGISRQTIKSHADKKLYGLKPLDLGKSKVITRENLITYYRNYFGKDGLSFLKS